MQTQQAPVIQLFKIKKNPLETQVESILYVASEIDLNKSTVISVFSHKTGQINKFHGS